MRQLGLIQIFVHCAGCVLCQSLWRNLVDIRPMGEAFVLIIWICVCLAWVEIHNAVRRIK